MMVPRRNPGVLPLSLRDRVLATFHAKKKVRKNARNFETKGFYMIILPEKVKQLNQ